jgi:predicted nucleotidyltransferase
VSLRFGLKENVIQQIRTVLARYPQVERAILYGSRAKGNYRSGSDIDVTLLGREDLTLDVLLRIMGDIDDLLLPYTVELSILRDIHDRDLLDHIRRVGVTFYEKMAPAGRASEV